MDYSWELLLLVCAYITVFGSQKLSVRADDEKYLSESNSSKPSSVQDYNESTTESSAKKKNAISELRNSNILRDKNAHSLVTENVKTLLDDIMKSAVRNKSDVASENLESEQVSSLPPESSDISHTRKSLLNVLGTVPRNVRDLIPDSEDLSNGTNSTFSDSTVTVLKENKTSLYNGSDGASKTPSISEPDITSNQPIFITNRTDSPSSTSVPPSPKIRDKVKPKSDMNPKQFKKPSINFKNKPHVITNYNISIEAIKPENITEYSTDEPINDNLATDNVTNIVPLINGTSKHNSGNATVSSLQTLPESESWTPLTVILIGAGVLALISIVSAIGMFSVVLYRRYHWNKPQTFSDKCSNADSTGYIDDSTLKENSEEMYSLDNDSFLNSLEAMTIQNYWADSIRHTKL